MGVACSVEGVERVKINKLNANMSYYQLHLYLLQHKYWNNRKF